MLSNPISLRSTFILLDGIIVVVVVVIVIIIIITVISSVIFIQVCEPVLYQRCVSVGSDGLCYPCFPNDDTPLKGL